jgi:hypothetical protein
MSLYPSERLKLPRFRFLVRSESTKELDRGLAAIVCLKVPHIGCIGHGRPLYADCMLGSPKITVSFGKVRLIEEYRHMSERSSNRQTHSRSCSASYPFAQIDMSIGAMEHHGCFLSAA